MAKSKFNLRDFVMYVIYGAIIGVGVILPGVSGGVLCVAFGFFEPFMELLTVNDNWLDVYGEPTFITINLDDGNVAGDLYGWQFNYGTITDTSDRLTSTGSQSALFTLIVDGTGDFEGVTGILGGNTVVSDQEGWGIAEYGNDEPLCALTLMKGSLKVPADSAAAEYGNDLITD